MSIDYKTGDRVVVRAHTSPPGKGLTYPEFTGVLIEDAGVSEGWDVVACRDDISGRKYDIYCYSIKRD